MEEAYLVEKVGVRIIDILRKDENRQPYMELADVATAFLSRDYKGVSNYANGLVEVWKIKTK